MNLLIAVIGFIVGLCIADTLVQNAYKKENEKWRDQWKKEKEERNKGKGNR